MVREVVVLFAAGDELGEIVAVDGKVRVLTVGAAYRGIGTTAGYVAANVVTGKEIPALPVEILGTLAVGAERGSAGSRSNKEISSI